MSTVNSEKVTRRFAALPGKVKESLIPALNRIGAMLAGYVQTQKLQGQVLNHRSGRLSNAVTFHEAQDSGSAVSVKVGVYQNVPYARIHEYGGYVHVPEVSGPLMVFQGSDGNTVFTRRHKAFTATMPERSYLRSSLGENRESYIDIINRTVADAL